MSLSISDYVQQILSEAALPKYNGYTVNVTGFGEEKPELVIEQNGNNNAVYYLDFFPKEYSDKYKASGITFLPIQAEKTFEGLKGMRNLFTYFPEQFKNNQIISDMIYYLENQYQKVVQQERAKKILPSITTCKIKENPKPKRREPIFGTDALSFITNIKNESGNKVFTPEEASIILQLTLFRNGKPFRPIIDLATKSRQGKSLEILTQFMVYGYPRMYIILTSQAWETRSQILKYVPGNKKPRQLADINIEQLLYVPKFQDTGVACGKCGNTENQFFTYKTRAADEPLTTKYICGNPRCRNVWREEG